MKNFTEREVRVLEKQRAVLNKVRLDTNYPYLEAPLRAAVELSLRASAEVLL